MNASNRTISTEDGRKIRILEEGQPDGVPVLVHRGTPQSRLLYDRWVEDAQSRGIRLIGYERPGYGGSTRHPGRTVASAANDVAAIAKELGLNRLLVWGVTVFPHRGLAPHQFTPMSGAHHALQRPAIALLLQASVLVGRVAELALGVTL